MQLTREQHRIVHHQGGHSKISAVAGSGKTTTMISRIAYLLDQGVSAQKLLVLMFNKSARDSFDVKLHKLSLPHGQQLPEVRTFHSLGLRLINSFTRQGHLPQCKLQTEEFLVEKLARQSINQVLEQSEGSAECSNKENTENFLTFIDLVKSDIRPVEQVFKDLNMEERFDYFIDAFKLFEKSRKSQNIRFYADLIYDPVLTMLGDSQVSKWVGGHVEHIIVDEYQDINEIQQQLLKFIAGKHADVMVVGDVDQCIYEWRGAKPQYITTRFEHDFPGGINYTLSYTFRYGHRLSLAANHLISNNKMRDRKLCLSFPNTPDTRIDCLEEGIQHPILSILQKWKDGKGKLRDCAVLVRMFAMAVPVEFALLEQGICYCLEGHESVFDCREIRALQGFLQLCEGSLGQKDPKDTTQIIEAMLGNPHIGLKGNIISQLAVKIAKDPQKAPQYILGATDHNTPYFLQEQLHERAEAWQEIMDLPASGKAGDILEIIIETSDLFSFYHRISTRKATAVNRIKTCIAFQRFADRLNSPVSSFLRTVERLQEGNREPHPDRLLITSIHRAKGLEWPLVIIPGLEDGMFPLLPDEIQSPFDNLEDERRLFYVAMTRGIRKVVFTHPHDPIFTKRKKRGSCYFPPRADSQKTAPASRFLYESNLDLSDRLGGAICRGDQATGTVTQAETIHMANKYLKAIDSSMPLLHSTKKSKKEHSVQRDNSGFFTIGELAEGVMVRSAFFGVGVVSKIIDRSSGKICVVFNDHGEKILVTAIARLKPL